MVPELVERSFFIANMSYTIPTKLLCKVTKKIINNQIYFKSIRSASQLFSGKDTTRIFVTYYSSNNPLMCLSKSESVAEIFSETDSLSS